MLTFTVVGYKYRYEWHCFINSLLLQTDDRWFCQLYNDGPDPVARDICESYIDQFPDKFTYTESPKRARKFGHNMRRDGLSKTVSKYWSTQNADNYLMPVFVDYTISALEKGNDLVVFPCVHNYANVDLNGSPPYSVLDTYPKRLKCDAGSFVISTERAQRVGWKSLENVADGIFIDSVMKNDPHWTKLPNVLMVHN